MHNCQASQEPLRLVPYGNPGADALRLALARNIPIKLLLRLLDHPDNQADNYGHHQDRHPVSPVSAHPSGAPGTVMHHVSVLRQSATGG
jgi:hypothetical protein